MRDVGQHVGSLDVRGNVAGAEVRVEGRRVGSLPFARPVRVAAVCRPLARWYETPSTPSRYTIIVGGLWFISNDRSANVSW